MWNEKRSLALSKLSVYLFMLALVGVLLAGPWLVGWLQSRPAQSADAPAWCFYATIYTGGVPAALLLFDLLRLLHNLEAGKIFVADNEAKLRRISWYCIAGGGIAVVSALYYLPWLFIGLAAAFVGLIVRVVKNVVAEAILLKKENDYTI